MADSGKSHKVKAPRVVSKRFISALSYAAQVHSRQIRKRTERPYIGHLLGVASIVIEYGGDEEMAIAALLHDAVEDPGRSKPGCAKSGRNSANVWRISWMGVPIRIRNRRLPGWKERASTLPA